MTNTKIKIMFLRDYVDVKSMGMPVVVEMAEEAVLLGDSVRLNSGIVLNRVPKKYYAIIKD